MAVAVGTCCAGPLLRCPVFSGTLQHSDGQQPYILTYAVARVAWTCIGSKAVDHTVRFERARQQRAVRMGNATEDRGADLATFATSAAQGRSNF